MNPEIIRLIDLTSEEKNQALEEIFDGIRKVYQSSQFILGEPVTKFESTFVNYTGAKFAVGLNSGTDAIILALRVLGIGPGDEVITVSNSFIATVSPIGLVGATPVFVDIGEDYNIDPALIEAKITKKTKAIIPVHLTGNPCRMDEIMEIAKRNNLFVIEDAAQAIGAKWKNQSVGTFGEFGAFSLHPLKNLHLWGDGGMVTMNSEAHMTAMRYQRNHGLINRDEVDFFSYNSRLDTIQAVVGLSAFKMLAATTAARHRNAAVYDERLKDLTPQIRRPLVDRTNSVHVFHLYVVVAEDRNQLQQHLLKDGIETKIHYPIPSHMQKACSYLGYKKGSLPVTERLADGILSLPVRENLKESHIHRICDSIQRYYKGH